MLTIKKRIQNWLQKWKRIIEGRDPVDVTPADFPALENGFSQATRNSSQDALNVVAAKLPTFLGGSADLAHSNMTYIKTDGLQDDSNRLNRNIQFGVREFAMGTILNGMALHGGLRVYGGTFFVFSDYVKAAVRLSALQGLPVTLCLYPRFNRGWGRRSNADQLSI